VCLVGWAALFVWVIFVRDDSVAEEFRDEVVVGFECDRDGQQFVREMVLFRLWVSKLFAAEGISQRTPRFCVSYALSGRIRQLIDLPLKKFG
jgi:hypothetical protein